MIQNNKGSEFGCVIKNRNQKLLNHFGAHLRRLRTDKGLSQEELAYQADIPISQVGRIERGEVNVTISTIHQISLALGLSLTDLVNFGSNPLN